MDNEVVDLLPNICCRSENSCVCLESEVTFEIVS